MALLFFMSELWHGLINKGKRIYVLSGQHCVDQLSIPQNYDIANTSCHTQQNTHGTIITVGRTSQCSSVSEKITRQPEREGVGHAVLWTLGGAVRRQGWNIPGALQTKQDALILRLGM